MLLTIRTTHQPATDLGFLLHKHPEHVHTREFPFGNATVFYPEASEESCTRRGSESIASPPTDMRLEHGDVLYLVGDESDMVLARRRLTTEP